MLTTNRQHTVNTKIRPILHVRLRPRALKRLVDLIDHLDRSTTAVVHDAIDTLYETTFKDLIRHEDKKLATAKEWPKTQKGRRELIDKFVSGFGFTYREVEPDHYAIVDRMGRAHPTTWRESEYWSLSDFERFVGETALGEPVDAADRVACMYRPTAETLWDAGITLTWDELVKRDDWMITAAVNT